MAKQLCVAMLFYAKYLSYMKCIYTEILNRLTKYKRIVKSSKNVFVIHLSHFRKWLLLCLEGGGDLAFH